MPSEACLHPIAEPPKHPLVLTLTHPHLFVRHVLLLTQRIQRLTRRRRALGELDVVALQLSERLLHLYEAGLTFVGKITPHLFHSTHFFDCLGDVFVLQFVHGLAIDGAQEVPGLQPRQSIAIIRICRNRGISLVSIYKGANPLRLEQRVCVFESDGGERPPAQYHIHAWQAVHCPARRLLQLRALLVSKRELMLLHRL